MHGTILCTAGFQSASSKSIRFVAKLRKLINATPAATLTLIADRGSRQVVCSQALLPTSSVARWSENCLMAAMSPIATTPDIVLVNEPGTKVTTVDVTAVKVGEVTLVETQLPKEGISVAIARP